MPEDRVPVPVRKILEWHVTATKNAVDWAFRTYPSCSSSLLLDVILVGLTKAITRRNRPNVSNDMFFSHGPDKFSFASGHASRAVFLSLLLTHTILPSLYVLPILYAWAGAVFVSRDLLRRHHIVDVACGAIFGVLEFYVLWGILWASESTSRTVGNCIAGAEDEFNES